MNEKDIYELIDNSFDDKIKLNFDDVKKRIAALPQSNVTPIASAAPSVSKGKKNFYKAIAAAAACLVCVIALSAVFSQPKSDSASMKSESYFNAAEEPATYDSAVCYSAEADLDETVNESFLSDDCEVLTADEFMAFGTVSSPSDCISETDISASDVN